jgi:predicted acyl esterase
MIKWLAVVWMVSCLAGVAVAAEDLDFHAPQSASGPQAAAAMRSLAERALPVYENPDRAEFLANLSALQMVAGEYAAADATRQSLHEFRERQKTARPVDLAVIYDMYAAARARARASGKPFGESFAAAFRAAMDRLSDANAFTLSEWLETPLSVYEGNLQRDLDRLQGKDHVSPDEAVDLAWAYLSYQAFRSFGPYLGKLIAADDAKRYIVQHDTIEAPERARLSIAVIRPRSAASPLPALLEFTDDPDARDRARECAAHGYAGVVAYSTSSGHAPADGVSGARAGEDARAVVEWIARQKWNDGRVGLYGSGASALAAWEAAKAPPSALAALAASSIASGIDATHAIKRRRRRAHPRERSPAIGYSVLTTTGFFDTNEAATVGRFSAEHRRDPSAHQWLLVGPYDSRAMRRGALPVLAGYSVDAAAIVDLRELRFEWFDHVLRGAPLPDLLSDRVNFEVMGANAWRHAVSIAAMANRSVRLYPNGTRTEDHFGLTGHEPANGEVAEALVRLSAAAPGGTTGSSSAAGAEESDEGVGAIVTSGLEPHESVIFVSGPLHRPLEVSGRVSGVLDFSAPRVGVSVALALYELSPAGEYFRFLSLPDALCRACTSSRDLRRSRRRERRRVPFESDRLTSVELRTGSRIVLVLEARGLEPERRRRVRVRDRHHAAKAAAPAVKWYGGTVVELPIWREGGL